MARKRNYPSAGARYYLDASITFDYEELMPEEIAVLKLIHATRLD